MAEEKRQETPQEHEERRKAQARQTQQAMLEHQRRMETDPEYRARAERIIKHMKEILYF